MKVHWDKSCVEIGDIINAPNTCALTRLIMQIIAKLATVEMRWCHGKKQQNGRRSCS